MAKSRRAKKQIKESDPKMGFVGRPNKALANLEFKRPIWSQIGVELDGRKREEERRKRKKKKGRSSSKAPLRYGTWIFGMETHLVYESYEIMHEFPCFDGYPLAQI